MLGDKLYTSKLLTDVWGLGHVTIGELTTQSAGYVARYVMKKIRGTQADDHYSRVELATGEIYQLTPEFCTMSRNPGLGQTFMDRYPQDIFNHDSIVLDGKKYRIPRYYDKKLEKLDPHKLEDKKFKRETNARKLYADNTEERLNVKEIVFNAKTQSLNNRNLK